jgi:hypothetical protein
MSTCTSIRHRVDRSIYRVLVSLTLILTLTGCATCERHPVECGVVVGIVATSIALSVNHPDRDHHEPAVGPERPICGRGPC